MASGHAEHLAWPEQRANVDGLTGENAAEDIRDKTGGALSILGVVLSLVAPPPTNTGHQHLWLISVKAGSNAHGRWGGGGARKVR